MTRNDGYSLLEVVITCGIVCVLASITMAIVRAPDHLLLKREVMILAHAILCGQAEAIATGASTKITCDNITHSFYAQKEHHRLASGVCFGAGNVKGPPATPTQVIYNPITFPGNEIVCYPNGTTSAGSIYLTNATQSVTYAITLGVAQAPYLRIWRYDRQWQLLS